MPATLANLAALLRHPAPGKPVITNEGTVMSEPDETGAAAEGQDPGAEQQETPSHLGQQPEDQEPAGEPSED
jgi:hypothetical protein